MPVIRHIVSIADGGGDERKALLSQHNKAKMVVRLRLQRFGRKHLPFYRIVVADSRSPRDGKFIERVSFTNGIATVHGQQRLILSLIFRLLPDWNI